MALKDVVAKRVLEDILSSLYKEGSWKVLILDHLSTRIISSCCKMSDVMSKGITLVEALEKSRQPLPHLEAIYIIVPSDKTIAAIVSDFDKEPRYKAAHIFFLEKCSSSLFNKLGTSRTSRRIQTLKEVNMAFLPYESNVFTLDYPQAFGDFYGPQGKSVMCERIADQLVTVCAMLGEYPAVRYRSDGGACIEVAEALQGKLDTYKKEKRDLGSGEKSKSQLIILDRGFDAVSPILHELTFQAMVYDLLKVDNDVFMYQASTGAGDKKREAILDENDAIWTELRHQHIAEVSQEVHDKWQDFAKKKKLKHADDPDLSIKDLGRYIRKVPQYQKELSRYSLHVRLAEQCMRLYRSGINNVCKVEQDLAMGTDPHGGAITDPMKDMMPVLFDRQIKVYDKIRLLMLYILFKKGVSRDDFMKLMQHSEIPHGERKVILNLMHLGYNILNEERVKTPKHKLKMKERPGEKYEVSRWTPVVQDIIEYAIADQLDDSYCPYLKGKSRLSSSSQEPTTSSAGVTGASVRQRWKWIPEQRTEASKPQPVQKTGPTIIVFIIGGMTYSEMRAAYEVAQSSSYEVIVGSTNIITPSEFLGQLKELKPLVAA